MRWSWLDVWRGVFSGTSGKGDGLHMIWTLGWIKTRLTSWITKRRLVGQPVLLRLMSRYVPLSKDGKSNYRLESLHIGLLLRQQCLMLPTSFLSDISLHHYGIQ